MSRKRRPQGIPTQVDDALHHPWERWAPKERKIKGQGVSRQWFLWANREQKRHGLPFAGSHRESSRDSSMSVRSWSGKPASSSRSECTGWLPQSCSRREERLKNMVRVAPDLLAWCRRAVPGVFNSAVTSMSYPVSRLWISVACKGWVQVTWEFILMCLCWMRRPLEK